MNPFDLKGPEFLLFYAVLGIATVIIIRILNRIAEAGEFRSKTTLTDPYEIAFLRSGAFEAIRVATVSLIDRGLLKAKNEDLIVARTDADKLAQRPIERAILSAFTTSKSAYTVLKPKATSALDAACDLYKTSLQDKRLLPDKACFTTRLPGLLIGLGLALGVGITKIAIAIGRGKHNIVFLIIMMILFSIAVIVAFRKRRTRAGDVALEKLKDQFSQLKSRAKQIKPGGSINEVALVAALWGLSMLPATQFPYIRQLYPQAASSTGGDTWIGGCGGGSSSSDSGGGSSCGGGGCGGGCGGCGG